MDQLPLLLLPLAAVPHRAAAAQLGESCQLADSEKVDCGQVGTDQAGCEAMGCCWQPVNAASTKYNSSRTGKYSEFIQGMGGFHFPVVIVKLETTKNKNP